MNKIKIICGLIGLWIFQANSAQEIDLTNSKVVRLSTVDFEALPQSALFCWSNTKLGSATFLSYEHGAVGFCKMYTDNLPIDLTAQEKERFAPQPISIDGEQHTAYVFSCGSKFMDKVDLREYCKKDNFCCQDSYHLVTPLHFGEALPKKLTLDELCCFLSGRRVIIYTGAGVSADAGVNTMAGLQARLGLNKQLLVDDLTHAVLRKGEKMLRAWSSFCVAMFTAAPTKAHMALAKIALEKGVFIFTENIDYLHERTGIAPVRPTKQRVLDKIRPSDLVQLDAIVCIGLSGDDKGFLAYYKLQNPSGIIIAIDLKQPSYLNSEDYFLEGDLQKIVPILVEKMVQ